MSFQPYTLQVCVTIYRCSRIFQHPWVADHRAAARYLFNFRGARMEIAFRIEMHLSPKLSRLGLRSTAVVPLWAGNSAISRLGKFKSEDGAARPARVYLRFVGFSILIASIWPQLWLEFQSGPHRALPTTDTDKDRSFYGSRIEKNDDGYYTSSLYMFSRKSSSNY